MEEGFGFAISVALTLNYIIGTGFLTLPWAFFASGTVLATVVLFFVALMAVCSALMILEAMARASALSCISPHQVNVKAYPNYSAISTADTSFNFSNSCTSMEDEHMGPTNGSKRSDVLWQVGKRRIEIVELCDLFFPVGRPYFICIISISMYGALWAYCTVFANALATTLPLFGDYSYYFFLFVYSLVVVPMSCLELSEQVAMQLFYAFCRGVMVFFMLGSVAYAVLQTGGESVYSDDFSSRAGGKQESENIIPPTLVKWSGFKIIVPIALSASVFHHSLPALSEIVADKKQLGWVFSTTLFICFVTYSLIGVTLSTYFGSSVQSSSNLNWAHFYHKNSSIPLSIVSNYIILFPAVDVMSAFPLYAVTFGNNMHAFFMTLNKVSEADCYTGSSNNSRSGSSSCGTLFCFQHSHIACNTDRHRHRRQEVLWFRFLATIPPVIAACFIRDLGVLTKYMGITGFAIIFFYPVLLSHRSYWSLKEQGLNPRTYYTCMLTSNPFKVLLVVFGMFMILLTCFT